tara:strand:+ start:650 stop:907 length:258 start_codon:yes stop_codon:yes gene_type:complete
MNKNRENPEQNQSFEEAFDMLEQTVKKLEEGGLSLEESTSLFEYGINLAQICNQMLSETDLRITQLQTSFAEKMRSLYGEDDTED